MKQQTLEWGEGVTLTTYVLDGKRPRGAVLVLPGGAYRMTSDREAEPIALRFTAAGFHAFVLRYSVAPNRHPKPLQDAQKALDLIRSQSSEWNLDPAKVAVCGFSAGGHLAASLGVFGNPRPDALILSYPVITSGPFAHQGSFENLLGQEAPAPVQAQLSLETQVTDKTPPTFLWHTYDDAAVPLENTLLFAGALRQAAVPFELHVFPKGRHGISLAEAETDFEDGGGIDAHVARWMGLCVEWLTLQFL